jgi:hypothetical protein
MIRPLIKRSPVIKSGGCHPLEVSKIEKSRKALMEHGDSIFALLNGVRAANAQRAAALLALVLVEHDASLQFVSRVLSDCSCRSCDLI